MSSDSGTPQPRHIIRVPYEYESAYFGTECKVRRMDILVDSYVTEKMFIPGIY